MLYIPHPYKRCSTCGQFKRPDQFPRDKGKSDRLSSTCSTCNNERAQKWAKEHPEQTVARKKQWYQNHRQQIVDRARKYRQNNPEKMREGQRRRRKEHPEKEKGYSHRYKTAHPTKVKESRKRYAKEHTETIRVKCQRYRSRKRALPAAFRNEDWLRSLSWWNGCCAYCGNPPRLWDNPRTLHQDHYIPTSKGGGYTPDNIVPACQACNCSKQNRDPREWLIDKFGKKQAKLTEQRIRVYFAWIKEQ